eukprot:308626_1
MAVNDLRIRRLVRTVINESTDETTMGHMRGLTEKNAGQTIEKAAFKKAVWAVLLGTSKATERLKEMAHAVKLGPSFYKGLSEMIPEDAEEEMARRIRKAGVTWKGEYPRTKEITSAGNEYKRQKEPNSSPNPNSNPNLDGLDEAAIITGKKRSRSSHNGPSSVSRAVHSRPLIAKEEDAIFEED